MARSIVPVRSSIISTTEASPARPGLRIVDSGTRGGRENIALDQALIESHRAGTSVDTLRLLTFSPSALVGRHQDLSREIDVKFCRQRGIDIGRRVTGGGAIYLDEGQIGWELICRRTNIDALDLSGIAAKICGAMAEVISRFGVRAEYRPRNDIEVGGKKIAGTGGFFDGGTLFYQGTLIIDLDHQQMFDALRVPRTKRLRHAADAAARVTSLRAACEANLPPREELKRSLAYGLADLLGFGAYAGILTAAELKHAKTLYDEEIGEREFVHDIDDVKEADGWQLAERTAQGGQLRAAVRCWPHSKRLQQVLLTDDHFATPPRLTYDLECRLKDVALSDLELVVREFFATNAADFMSISVDDVVAVLRAASTAESAIDGGP